MDSGDVQRMTTHDPTRTFCPVPHRLSPCWRGPDRPLQLAFGQERGGVLVLRIEDTDRERSSEEHTQAILHGMEWLGVTGTKGPFFQSEGLERHKAAALSLLESGQAYRDFSTPEEAARGSGRGDRPPESGTDGPGSGPMPCRRGRSGSPHRGRRDLRRPVPGSGRAKRSGMTGSTGSPGSGTRRSTIW